MPAPADPATGYVGCPPGTGPGFVTSQTSTPKTLALILAMLNGSYVGSDGQATDGIPVVFSSSPGTQRTFNLKNATGNGTITAGTRSVGFASSSDFTGTITGSTFGASQAIGTSADGNDTIGAIDYTVSAGTLYIATLM